MPVPTRTSTAPSAVHTLLDQQQPQQQLPQSLATRRSPRFNAPLKPAPQIYTDKKGKGREITVTANDTIADSPVELEPRRSTRTRRAPQREPYILSDDVPPHSPSTSKRQRSSSRSATLPAATPSRPRKRKSLPSSTSAEPSASKSRPTVALRNSKKLKRSHRASYSNQPIAGPSSNGEKERDFTSSDMPLDAMSPLTTFSDDEDSMDVDASRSEEQHTPSSPVDSDMGDSTVTARVNRNAFSPDNSPTRHNLSLALPTDMLARKAGELSPTKSKAPDPLSASTDALATVEGPKSVVNAANLMSLDALPTSAATELSPLSPSVDLPLGMSLPLYQPLIYTEMDEVAAVSITSTKYTPESPGGPIKAVPYTRCHPSILTYANASRYYTSKRTSQPYYRKRHSLAYSSYYHAQLGFPGGEESEGSSIPDRPTPMLLRDLKEQRIKTQLMEEPELVRQWKCRFETVLHPMRQQDPGLSGMRSLIADQAMSHFTKHKCERLKLTVPEPAGEVQEWIKLQAEELNFYPDEHDLSSSSDMDFSDAEIRAGSEDTSYSMSSCSDESAVDGDPNVPLSMESMIDCTGGYEPSTWVGGLQSEFDIKNSTPSENSSQQSRNNDWMRLGSISQQLESPTTMMQHQHQAEMADALREQQYAQARQVQEAAWRWENDLRIRREIEEQLRLQVEEEQRQLRLSRLWAWGHAPLHLETPQGVMFPTYPALPEPPRLRMRYKPTKPHELKPWPRHPNVRSYIPENPIPSAIPVGDGPGAKLLHPHLDLTLRDMEEDEMDWMDGFNQTYLDSTSSGSEGQGFQANPGSPVLSDSSYASSDGPSTPYALPALSLATPSYDISSLQLSSLATERREPLDDNAERQYPVPTEFQGYSNNVCADSLAKVLEGWDPESAPFKFSADDRAAMARGMMSSSLDGGVGHVAGLTGLVNDSSNSNTLNASGLHLSSSHDEWQNGQEARVSPSAFSFMGDGSSTDASGKDFIPTQMNSIMVADHHFAGFDREERRVVSTNSDMPSPASGNTFEVRSERSPPSTSPYFIDDGYGF